MFWGTDKVDIQLQIFSKSFIVHSLAYLCKVGVHTDWTSSKKLTPACASIILVLPALKPNCFTSQNSAGVILSFYIPYFCIKYHRLKYTAYQKFFIYFNNLIKMMRQASSFSTLCISAIILFPQRLNKVLIRFSFLFGYV